MRAGTLRNTISIENKIDMKNEYGEKISTWVLFKEIKASIEDIKDSDAQNGNSRYSIGTKRFRIRYMVGVDLKMRVKHDGFIYEIEDIQNTYQKNKELLIFAKRVY